MASILQGVDNLYEIDTTWKILDRAAELTEQDYGREAKADVALRVIADHVAQRGHAHRGRRAARQRRPRLRAAPNHAAQHQEPPPAVRLPARRGHDPGEHFMHDLTTVAIEAMAPLYPELRRDAPNILTVMDAEEAAFSTTLRTGTAIFEVAVEENKRKNCPASPAPRPSSCTTRTASRST